MRTRSWALAGLAAVVFAAGSAATAAAGLWSAPVELAQDGLTVAGDVAVDADGSTVAAWAADGGPARAAVRPGIGAFAPTVTLAPDGGKGVAVALGGGGRALVAWSRNGTLGLAERTGPGAPLTDVPTGGMGTGLASGPDVAFTGADIAIVVWIGTDGAIHALSHQVGGTGIQGLPDIAPGPGNHDAHVDAAGGQAVAAWTHVATAGQQTTTHVRASVMPPTGAFGAPEDLADAFSDRGTMFGWSGSELAARRVVVSENGSVDVLMTELVFLGPPGEVGMAGHVAARTAGAWSPAQRLGGTDLALGAGRFAVDVAAGVAGDALYVQGAKAVAPTMEFSARSRPATSADFGDASALFTGAPGEVLAAPLAAGRFLTLMRSGTGLRSRAGSPATEFGDPLVFSGTDGAQLIALDGAPTGLAAGLWTTTTGRIHAAVYDDSLRPSSLPPNAGPDTTDPRLTRLKVSPRRFAARRRARIRWRLSEPARVRIRVERVRRGYRRGGRCVARPPVRRRCTRFRHVGTLTRVGQAGRTTVRIDRFVRRRGLEPGSYRITAVPRDAAGNRGRAKRTGFTLIRRG